LTNDILLLSLITNAVLFWKLANRNRMLALTAKWLVRISQRNVELVRICRLLHMEPVVNQG
jgi:hypothetical protein